MGKNSMPKKRKKNNSSRLNGRKNIQYADYSVKQQYAKIIKHQGGRPPVFLCRLLDGQERPASLHNGAAREARQKGINKVSPDYWVLIQPISADVDGKQEILTVYTKSQHKQLENEGKLRIIQEKPKVENKIKFNDEEEVNQNESNALEKEIDIDEL